MWTPLLTAAVLAAQAAPESVTPKSLPQIEVIERRPAPQREAIDADTAERLPLGDASEWLRGLPGVQLARMGGHGLEPVIRGQSQTQLRVLIDGVEVHGACPNRMDPPTAFASAGQIDRMVVSRGVQTLTTGPGAGGGTLSIESSLPWLATQARQQLQAAWRENGATRGAGLDAQSAGGDNAFRATLGWQDAGNYRDGAGEAVRSAYRQREADLRGGVGFGDGQRVELLVKRKQARDVLFAGAGMDAPIDDLDSLQLRHAGQLGRWTVESRVARAAVDHLMNNYALRPLAGMAMRVPATSDTDTLQFDARDGVWSLGFAWNRNQREALRFAGPNPSQVTQLNSVMWPDAQVRRAGLHAEGQFALDAGATLGLGLRLDRHDWSAALADLQPTGMSLSPRALWTRYYGAEAARSRGDDLGVGALLRYARPLASGAVLSTSLSRSVRVADASERFLAANGSPADRRWVGNPGLKPEVQHQLDIGWQQTTASGLYELSGWYNDVSDYITRDRARGQAGILQRDGASIYRNVEARLYGAEARWIHDLSRSLSTELTLAWTRGDNRSDGRPLPLIAPLSGQLGLRWAASESIGTLARLRFAARQDRVDASAITGSALDAGVSPGWAVLDLQLSWQSGAHRLRLHLDNVFDRAYAEHVSRANADPFNPEAVRVNEPGRSLGVEWSVGF